jgi:chemotaxis protein methyltransferase CheR
MVYKRFGIVLSEQKRSLVTGRLNKVLRQNGFTSFKDYYDYVVADTTGKALSIMIDKISTNHTFFYREADHFQFLLNTAFPELIDRKPGRNRMMRIWCAASSSGEEPYTLAMLMHEHLKHQLPNWDTGVLATDISIGMLEIARAGIYSNDNVLQLPVGLRTKYLERSDREDYWAIKQYIKDLVLFRRLNLMNEKFPFKGKFQIIFARNVMIYFDEITRQNLVKKFYDNMIPGGYLFIGHSETLGRNNKLFKYICPAVYRKGFDS